MTKQEKSEMIKLIGNVKPFYVETIAEALYDAGYRKVLLDTKDGKVVDVVQYAPWQLIEGYTEREVEKARKETAKEILNGMLKKMYKLTGCGVPYHVRAFIKEFAEEYGVEVEE